MTTLRLKYNPSHMPEDDLIRSFVVRERDLAIILETVRENTGASNQHLLLLGPRGMGKTTLVNRAVAEIRRDPELSKLWYPIVFDEESYTVTSAGELWFQALSHLADQTQEPALARARDALQTLPDRTRLRDASLARILEFADTQQKRLLLAFENVDMIFDEQMGEDDGWDVRHTLQNEPRIMVLATSTTRLDSFHDSRKPLYELFREHTLERLELEECRTVWHLVTDAALPLHQARPIQIFTGGNTRLLTILASFAKDRSFRELMDDLVGLIDENTSYFKHNIEALPSASRKIFVTLADLWSPATSRQVAEQTRGDIRAVSAQLGRLEQQGIVEVVRRVDRTQMFQVAERMYNLYYLLRRRGAGRVRAVVEFIVRYYDQDGMQRMLASMAHEACELAPGRREDNIQAFTEILRRIPDAAHRLAALQCAPDRFLNLPDVAGLLPTVALRQLDAIQRSEPDLRTHLRENPLDIQAAVILAELLNARGSPEEALEIIAPMLMLGDDHPGIMAAAASAIMTYWRDQDTPIDAVRRAIDATRQANLPRAYPGLALLLIRYGGGKQARDIANDALDRWPDSSMTAAIAGVIFLMLDDQDAAESALTHALELDPANPVAVRSKTGLLLKQGRIEAAEAHLRGSLEHFAHRPELWLALIEILVNHRREYEAALEELTRAVAIFPTHIDLLTQLGALQIRLDRFADAEATYRTVVALGSDSGIAKLVETLIYQRKFSEAHAAIGERHSDSPTWHLARGMLDVIEGSYQTARRHLRFFGTSEIPDYRSLVLTVMWQMRLHDVVGAYATLMNYQTRGPNSRLSRLQELSVVVLAGKHAEFYSDLVRWTREIAADKMSAQSGNILLVQALTRTADWDELWSPLTAMVSDPGFGEFHLTVLVQIASLAAAHGNTRRTLEILAASPSTHHFEPLLVALHRVVGEPTNPPQEISEVADDIVRDIEQLRKYLAAPPPRPAASSAAHQMHRKTRKLPSCSVSAPRHEPVAS